MKTKCQYIYFHLYVNGDSTWGFLFEFNKGNKNDCTCFSIWIHLCMWRFKNWILFTQFWVPTLFNIKLGDFFLVRVIPEQPILWFLWGTINWHLFIVPVDKKNYFWITVLQQIAFQFKLSDYLIITCSKVGIFL